MSRRRPGRALTGLLALLLAGCATLSPQQRSAAAAVAVDARSTEVDCVRADACALPSPLMAMARDTLAASTPAAPRHRALILDDAPDALTGCFEKRSTPIQDDDLSDINIW